MTNAKQQLYELPMFQRLNLWGVDYAITPLNEAMDHYMVYAFGVQGLRALERDELKSLRQTFPEYQISTEPLLVTTVLETFQRRHHFQLLHRVEARAHCFWLASRLDNPERIVPIHQTKKGFEAVTELELLFELGMALQLEVIAFEPQVKILLDQEYEDFVLSEPAIFYENDEYIKAVSKKDPPILRILQRLPWKLSVVHDPFLVQKLLRLNDEAQTPFALRWQGDTFHIENPSMELETVLIHKVYLDGRRERVESDKLKSQIMALFYEQIYQIQSHAHPEFDVPEKDKT